MKRIMYRVEMKAKTLCGTKKEKKEKGNTRETGKTNAKFLSGKKYGCDREISAN